MKRPQTSRTRSQTGSSPAPAPGSDLSVRLISEALAGVHLDVVVSGSIGAVESVRFIRSLRRLGADVTPWLTRGGAQFVTPMAVGWAAARETRTAFEAEASHLAEGAGCIVAPASASFIAKIANGITDSPASALVTSYIGSGRPVLVLPSMHDSLADAPQVRNNLEKLRECGENVVILAPRLEEGKHKVPEPAVLADECAHAFNRIANKTRGHDESVMLTMGGTRAWIDDVRHIGNYSSGRLGTAITTELHRMGFRVHVLAAAAEFLPASCTTLTRCLTNEELDRAAAKLLAGKDAPAAIVHAAAVLDFAPAKKRVGKTPSSEEKLQIELTATPKILASFKGPCLAKVAFKLETDAGLEQATAIAKKYVTAHQLTMMVVNNLTDVGPDRHKGLVFECPAAGQPVARPFECNSRDELAKTVARHVMERLTRHN